MKDALRAGCRLPWSSWRDGTRPLNVPLAASEWQAALRNSVIPGAAESVSDLSAHDLQYLVAAHRGPTLNRSLGYHALAHPCDGFCWRWW